MSFNPSALNERTLKQFVDRLAALRASQPLPTHWPPKRSACQEEVARMPGFASWHQAIHAVRSDKGSLSAPTGTAIAATTGLYPEEPARWPA